MSNTDSDTETLYDEPTTISKPKLELGKHGLEWVNKFIRALDFRRKVNRLKAKGYTKDEIEDEIPEYYYDEEYHACSGMRRVKSTADLMGAVGTSTGYSGWEWCGLRSKEAPELREPPHRCMCPECVVS